MAFSSRLPSALAALLVLLAPAAAEAFALKRTAAGAVVHWRAADVAYAVDGSLEAAVPGGSAATAGALAAWSGTAGAPSLHVTSTPAAAALVPGYDRVNAVVFVPRGYAPAGRALAITVLTYDNTSGEILDADVIVNGHYPFAVLPVTATTKAPTEVVAQNEAATDGLGADDAPREVRGATATYDLPHVLAHEVGHSLGMSDEAEQRTSLMYRYSAPNDASVRHPTSDDVDGLSEIYGAALAAGGEGCTGAHVASARPAPEAARAAAWLAVGLTLFVLVRARRRRTAFAIGAAAALALALPDLGAPARLARAAAPAGGQARARVARTTTGTAAGLLTTRFTLTTTACRVSVCPRAGHGTTWGGTVGGVTQEVDGAYVPTEGDDVDVTFADLDALAALRPLAITPRELAVKALARAR